MEEGEGEEGEGEGGSEKYSPHFALSLCQRVLFTSLYITSHQCRLTTVER